MARPEIRHSRGPCGSAGAALLRGGLVLALLLGSRWVEAATWKFTPGLQVQETWSDNVALESPALARSDFVSQLNPGLQVSATGGRLKLNMSAVWQIMKYANGTSPDRVVPTLNGSGSLEILEHFLYLDASGSVSQQSASALGARASQAANINANASRVSNYSFSPYLKGFLGHDLSYLVRLQETSTSSEGTVTVAASRSIGHAWSGNLRWGNTSRLVNLAADFSSTRTDFQNGLPGTSSRTGRLYAYLNPDSHLKLYVDAGRESNGGGTSTRNGGSGSIRGLGLQWQPSSRTSLSLAREWRYFGANDNVRLSHRFRRSALSLNYSRDRTTTQNLLLVNAVNPYYQQLSEALTSAIPDPVQRDLVVRQQLLSQGLNPDAVVPLDFISDNVMIRRALSVSLIVTGVRNTLSFLASRSDSRSDTQVSIADILSTYSDVRQSNLAVNWSLKVTPYSTFSANISRTTSDGTSLAGGIPSRSVTSQANLYWNTLLSPHATSVLNLRHVVASGTGSGVTNPYRENAVSATLGYKY